MGTVESDVVEHQGRIGVERVVVVAEAEYGRVSQAVGNAGGHLNLFQRIYAVSFHRYIRLSLGKLAIKPLEQGVYIFFRKSPPYRRDRHEQHGDKEG